MNKNSHQYLPIIRSTNHSTRYAQSDLANFQQDYRVFNIANVLLYLLRMLVVIKFQPRLGLISSTVATAAKDLAHWTIVFAMIMVIPMSI